uniref:RING-type domain-containing protein n=1 Tax=Globisporangium ultimum (strain ATCC 200006 / CBS 805.95 / DAOM BR144) TaxID=431595 RepID=K3X8Y4_GLOUD
MSHILQMLRDPKQTSASGAVETQILPGLVDALNDKSMLYKNPDALGEEAKRIYFAAFGSRDSHAQHEIQLCRAYFATEFQKLVVDPSKSAPSPTRFLERIFSPLISSSMRYKLRALFLEHNIEISEADSAIPAMATYTHQDFGSSVHYALQESLLYRPLAIPIIKLLERKRPRDEVTKYLETVEVEDLEHINQFVLARRFLRYHIKKSYESPSADGFTARSWSGIERICRIARRHHFEDEAHLYPLVSVKDFVANLEKQETLLSQLESSLKDFYHKQQASDTTRSHPCLECGVMVTKLEVTGYIICTACGGHFHLNCLHLPPSFAQFASNYTCPSCFLGRKR